MPAVIAQLKHLGTVYKRIRAIIGTRENAAAVAIDACFRQSLEEHGFKLGTLVQYPGGNSCAVIDSETGYRYLPNQTNPGLRKLHASLRIGDEVVFRVRGVKAQNTKGARLYHVTMTCLTEH